MKLHVKFGSMHGPVYEACVIEFDKVELEKAVATYGLEATAKLMSMGTFDEQFARNQLQAILLNDEN